MAQHLGSRATGRCSACDRPVFAGAEHCKARLCPRYAPVWARDQQRKVFENLTAYDDGDGTAAMFTVTAPGVDELPWDEHHCAALGEHRHSGLLGCIVQAEPARAWNATAPERWRRLHDRCARLTARLTGHRPRLLCRAWEQQQRGVLHVHATVGRGLGVDKLTAGVYAEQLHRLAPSYGFGSVDTPTGHARLARESAAYISSYLTKGKGSKKHLCETVRSHQLPHSVIHVDTRLTMRTHVTMRTLRFRRLVNHKWGVNLPFTEQHNVQLLCDAFDAELLETIPTKGPPDERC